MGNTDQGKYGSLLKNLNSQKSLGNDQYPKTITEANNVLSNHRFDNMNSNSRDNKKSKDNRNKNSDKRNDKEQEDSPSLSFTQLEGKFYWCGKPGHRSLNCYHKNKIPRE